MKCIGAILIAIQSSITKKVDKQSELFGQSIKTFEMGPKNNIPDKTITDKYMKNPNVVDEYGDPTIIAMYRYENYNAVKDLLERYDIDVNMKNNDGQTLLQYIIENCDDYNEDETYEIIELIVNNPKFNPNVTDRYGQTVLQYVNDNCDIIDEDMANEIIRLIETKK